MGNCSSEGKPPADFHAAGMQKPVNQSVNQSGGGYMSHNAAPASGYPGNAATPSYAVSRPPMQRAPTAVTDTSYHDQVVVAKNYNSDEHQRQRQAMLAATQARLNAQKSKVKSTGKYAKSSGVSEPASPTIQDGVITAKRRHAGSLESENPEWFGASAVSTRE